jgi:membrane protease YdiL (CAAX protease family)
VGSVLYLAGGVGAVGLLCRFIDRRSFADYGFHLNRSWWRDLGFGLFLGAFLMTGIFLTERSAGWVEVVGAGAASSAVPFGLAVLVRLIVYVAVGVNEELSFRGYQLKNLAEGLAGKRLGPRAALLLSLAISSVLFGVGHMTNKSATPLSMANIVIAGVLAGMPFLLTGELAVSIGLHISWNFFEGTVYGFAVSGSRPTTPLLSIRQCGPELWTGGAFGPEAGLTYIPWVLAGCVLIALWVKLSRRRLALQPSLAAYAPRIAAPPPVAGNPPPRSAR